MGLPSDFTSKHAKLDANISVMRGHLMAPDDPESPKSVSIQDLMPHAERVGSMLRGYLDEEANALLPQATRILGEALEEVDEISECNVELLDSFESFTRALESGDGVEDLDTLRERFEEFSACFERQRDAERNFYTLYSTILFPSGAATD